MDKPHVNEVWRTQNGRLVLIITSFAVDGELHIVVPRLMMLWHDSVDNSWKRLKSVRAYNHR